MKRLLVIVNLQNDFINGALGFPNASLIVDKILENIPLFYDFVFIKETHDNHYKDTIEAKYLDTPHTIKGTKGHDLVDELKPYEEKSIKSFESNSFGSKDFALWLSNNYYDEIVFSGIYSHIQVLENAVIARSFSPNSKIIINRELCASNDDTYKEYAYDVLRSNHIEVK